MKTKKKFKIVTLGCRTNQYESFAFQKQLNEMGFVEAKADEQADLCLVNTCTVTASADGHSRHQIRSLAKQNPNAEIVVTGCLADRDPKQLSAISGVSKVIPNKNKEALLQEIYPDLDVPEFSIENFPEHSRAFVKVQDGCNSFCTYCIIPYVRGRSRSKSISAVLKEIRALVANGFKEVVLTGINIGDFDGGKDDTLADLIRQSDQIEGLERIRVSSIDPDEVDDNLLDAIVNGKKTCHSMHLVLQSGSNVVLKKMNRKYTRQMFFDTAERLFAASPRFTLTTDIIVGFPGESEQDFNETLDVMKEVKFAKVHMFPYSERPRTRAALYPNKVAPEIIKERKAKVLQYSEELAFQLRNRFVGQRAWILTENSDAAHPGLLGGHTDNFMQCWIPKENYQTNELIEVELLENTPSGFMAQAVKKKEELLCESH